MGLEIECIGPSHGAIWRTPEGIEKILGSYKAWTRFDAPPRVALFYDTMWHSTERMTMAIEDGVACEGVECGVYRLTVNPRSEMARQVLNCQAFLVGTPTLNQAMFPTVGAFLTYIKGLKPKNRIAGAFGSYGWGGGAVKQVDAELRALGLDMIDPLEARYMPGPEELDACHELGRTVARRIKGEAV
jgi:anaerobic nitric oxide reductase flavorubredoxin